MKVLPTTGSAPERRFSRKPRRQRGSRENGTRFVTIFVHLLRRLPRVCVPPVSCSALLQKRRCVSPRVGQVSMLHAHGHRHGSCGRNMAPRSARTLLLARERNSRSSARLTKVAHTAALRHAPRPACAVGRLVARAIRLPLSSTTPAVPRYAMCRARSGLA